MMKSILAVSPDAQKNRAPMNSLFASQKTQDDSETLSKKETSNEWDMRKDGKQRFNPDKYPKEMRK